MKKLLLKIGIGIWLCCFFAACGEDDITPAIDFPHLYEITDDPNDPVQHKRFELYTTYRVPVYFNDTIAHTLVGEDRQGEPVYSVETLDMTWKFTSQEKNTSFEYVYLTKAEEQLNALHTVEKYLESLSVPLMPFSVLVTRSAVSKTGTVGEKISSLVGFRVVLITGAEDLDEAGTIALAAKLKKEMIAYKIVNYTSELGEFNKVSKDWYDMKWTGLPGVPAGFSSSQVFIFGPLPEEDLAEIRTVVGRFGFLGGQNDNVISWIGGGANSPKDKDQDLKMYLDEMLKYSKAKFKERWGHASLVMEKYDILYKVIAEKLEVEL